MRNVPHRLVHVTLVALIEKVVESLWGGASLEEKGHFGWASRLYSLASLTHLLLPECGCNVVS